MTKKILKFIFALAAFSCLRRRHGRPDTGRIPAEGFDKIASQPKPCNPEISYMPSLERLALDKIDKMILDILQENGKITNAKLSRIVGISAPATLERVRRLELSGVISHFTAVVDSEKIGFSITAMVSIALNLSKLNSVDEIKEEFAELEEVVECYQIAGAYDFILKVIAKDIKTYGEFINQKLTRIQGIQSIQSAFVIDSLKEKRKLFLGLDED